ncbi:MAG: mechanosensitive ion channel family protein [marine benthic group bacterium]|nr:mechanosensitive ion channel family protein [Candidatus Benthicola marisminoris]
MGVEFMDFLSEIVWGNSVETWLAGVAIFLGTALLLRFLVPILIRRATSLARSTSTYLDDSLVAAAGATRGFFYVAVGVWAGARYVRLASGVEQIFDQVLFTALLLQLCLWLVAGYRSLLLYARDHRYPDDPEVASSFNLIRLLGTGTIWFLVFVFVLQVWGVNVTALITGLGIGGIAIALAVQNILSDLFASLSIIFDKPFLVGDYLQVDSLGGTVESIGLKSTQLRSISGEQLVFSNSDLLNSRIRNYGRMEERRASFTLRIVYETDPAVVEKIPTWVREIVEAEEWARFARCHLKTLGEWALEFETVYHLTVPDYEVFMDVQQRVNLALMRRLTTAGVEFAYPTQLQYQKPLEPMAG